MNKKIFTIEPIKSFLNISEDFKKVEFIAYPLGIKKPKLQFHIVSIDKEKKHLDLMNLIGLTFTTPEKVNKKNIEEFKLKFGKKIIETNKKFAIEFKMVRKIEKPIKRKINDHLIL